MTKRDFKFRAYTEKYGLVAVRRLTNTTLDIFDVELENGVVVLAGSSRYPDVTIEQYTEVKDINGVEFYDNDIVRVEVSQPFEEVELGGRLSVIGVVKYDEGAYWVDWGTGRTRLWSETLQMTVLGNVHQNPELLEVF